MTKSYASLRFTMLSNLLFALGIAIALFILSNVILDRFVDVKYLAKSKQDERIAAYTEDLQKYVKENNVSSRDADKIAEWAKEQKYLYLLAYCGDELIYETGRNESDLADPDTDGSGSDADGETEKDQNKYHSTGITVKTPAREDLMATAVAGGSHKIRTTDGNIVVLMADYAEYLYYDIFNIVSIFLGFAGFVLVMWFYFFDITKKITRLGREVTAVADGDVTKEITADGEDEITRLCSDVEYMRISML